MGLPVCGFSDGKRFNYKQLNLGDAEAVRKNAYQLALGSDDPMFHAELYDWLVSQGRTDDLLEVSTPASSPTDNFAQYPAPGNIDSYSIHRRPLNQSGSAKR
jgi:hypothetical protein